ncbi:GNAT family N-acetyltransferase [Erythrobacter insulae]|uniref:GNAT family N-acetyltransferase n=1 Tax=Erythrobacter insulae TaxID=2584124 RepID=A0A547PEG5_9SPHN|nr:GNAT family N-acetyltransferase [Erythrobacter insulae]TRD12508.1 GNAT family N-acetyltransferase [Erythrobacter insulae]
MFVIEVRYHDSVNVLQGLSLQDDGERVAAPFDSAQWFAWLAETGLQPCVALATGDEQTLAMALTENSGRIEPLRNWYSFTWRPISNGGENTERLLTSIALDLKNRAHRVTLLPVPDEDGSASRLARAFDAAGWRVEVTQCDTNHILGVENRSFAEYWAARPGKLRTTLKRKANKVSVTITSQFDDGAWDDYERIYAASWKPVEGQPDMLRAYAKAEGAARRLRLGLAYYEGDPIAAQFWTVENGIAYIHKLAHLEEFKKLSAGTTLSAALFEQVIDTDRVKVVDFGTGNEPYKADWMESTRPRYQIDCINLRAPRGWADLARLTLGRLKSHDVPELARVPRSG